MLLRFFESKFREFLGGEYVDFVKQDVLELDGKQVLAVSCRATPSPVFFKIQETDGLFVRGGAHTGCLKGKAILDYYFTHFSKSRS